VRTERREAATPQASCSRRVRPVHIALAEAEGVSEIGIYAAQVLAAGDFQHATAEVNSLAGRLGERAVRADVDAQDAGIEVHRTRGTAGRGDETRPGHVRGKIEDAVAVLDYPNADDVGGNRHVD